MIIISEITGKEYNTVDECIAAEKEFLEKQEAAEKIKKAREEELSKAYDEAIAACDRYFELAGMDVEIDEDDNSCIVTLHRNGEDDEDFDKVFEQAIKMIFG